MNLQFSLGDVMPLDDRVLLLRLPDSYSGAIVIPDSAKKLSRRGKVLRTGPGRRFEDGGRRPVDVHAEQVVRYQSCDVDDGTYVLIQEGDILGIES